MKILSILPVDFEAVAPHVAAQKRNDKQILASLPSRVCHSFGVAQLLLQEYPLAYDVIVSTYTPDELLPARDRVPMAKNPYEAATRHITRILTDNPLASLVLWTGAISKEIDLPLALSKRISWILRGSAYFRGELRGVENAERDLLRYQITRALTEFCLMLNEKGEIVLEAICRRGPVEMVLDDSGRAWPVRPCLRKPIHSEEKQTDEFAQLLNRKGITAQDVASFLEVHPCFPLGNEMRVLRWMVGLRRDPPIQTGQFVDFLLEPAWVASRWKIPGLMVPGASRSLPANPDRKSFCENLAAALMQMCARQKTFDQPRFRRRLADVGLAGYAPRIALVLGDKEAPGLPQAPPDGFGKGKVMTLAELLIQARAEIEWMAEPTDRLDCMIAANVRKQKIREEMAAMWGNDKG